MKKPWLGLLIFLAGTAISFGQIGTITSGMVKSDSIGLMTRLILPENPVKKKPPVIIIVHGSGNKGSWTTYLPMVSRFSEQGLAVVFFDKRGTGQSEGIYTDVIPENSEELIEQLSNDVIAVADWTKKQARIDTTRIGVLGFSEGGWVAPRASEKSTVISFEVILSGPVCSVGQEFLYSQLSERYEGDGPMAQDSIFRRMEVFEGIHGFDALPHFDLCKNPSFWLFGEKDSSMAMSFSLEKLKSIMASSPEKEIQYKVYKNANHSLYDVDSKERKPYAGDIKEWLLSMLY